MKQILAIVGLLLCAFQSEAALDYGLEVGGRQQAADMGGTGVSANSQWGWQAGAYVNLPFAAQGVHWRTGLLYTQRPIQSENDTTGVKINYDMQYLDIPMDVLFKPSEELGFYFGFDVAVNISHSCSGDSSCSVKDVKSPFLPMNFGIMYKFTPKWGLDFYVDGSNAEVARDIFNFRAIGLNLTYSLN